MYPNSSSSSNTHAESSTTISNASATSSTELPNAPSKAAVKRPVLQSLESPSITAISLLQQHRAHVIPARSTPSAQQGAVSTSVSSSTTSSPMESMQPSIEAIKNATRCYLLTLLHADTPTRQPMGKNLIKNAQKARAQGRALTTPPKIPDCKLVGRLSELEGTDFSAKFKAKTVLGMGHILAQAMLLRDMQLRLEDIHIYEQTDGKWIAIRSDCQHVLVKDEKEFPGLGIDLTLRAATLLTLPLPEGATIADNDTPYRIMKQWLDCFVDGRVLVSEYFDDDDSDNEVLRTEVMQTLLRYAFRPIEMYQAHAKSITNLPIIQGRLVDLMQRIQLQICETISDMPTFVAYFQEQFLLRSHNEPNIISSMLEELGHERSELIKSGSLVAETKDFDLPSYFLAQLPTLLFKTDQSASATTQNTSTTDAETDMATLDLGLPATHSLPERKVTHLHSLRVLGSISSNSSHTTTMTPSHIPQTQTISSGIAANRGRGKLSSRATVAMSASDLVTSSSSSTTEALGALVTPVRAPTTLGNLIPPVKRRPTFAGAPPGLPTYTTGQRRVIHSSRHPQHLMIGGQGAGETLHALRTTPGANLSSSSQPPSVATLASMRGLTSSGGMDARGSLRSLQASRQPTLAPIDLPTGTQAASSSTSSDSATSSTTFTN